MNKYNISLAYLAVISIEKMKIDSKVSKNFEKATNNLNFETTQLINGIIYDSYVNVHFIVPCSSRIGLTQKLIENIF